MKLFEQNPYLTEFSAEVISRLTVNNQPAVVLSQTAFYPLGGGQEADHGTLNGIRVLDVQEKDEHIIHILEQELESNTVSGEIDWARRFDHMQQHTGEHILSGLVLQHFGASNVGFHIGDELMRVDYDIYLEPSELQEMERLANHVVTKNLIVDTSIYQTGDEDYRFKKALSGDIRVVDVPGIDRCACCGTHVSTTAQVGLIKIVESERYKGGVRLGVVCGDRALNYFQRLLDQTKSLMQVTSSQRFGILRTVEKKYEEADEQAKRLADLERRVVANLIEYTENATDPIVLFEHLGSKAIATLANALAERAPLIAIFTPHSEKSYRFYLHSKSDVTEVAKELIQYFGGKGGGKGTTAQGSVVASETELIEWMRNKK